MAIKSKEQIFDSIGKDVMIVDNDFNVLDANCHMLNHLNIDGRDAIGQKCYTITRCGPPDGNCPLKEALKTGNPSTKRCICYDRGGSKVYMEVAVYPLDEGENSDQFILIGTDITEIVNVESEIREYVSALTKNNSVNDAEREKIEEEIKGYIKMLSKRGEEKYATVSEKN